MADIVIVIPARMAATRLPGKPLADIAGVPMIVRVLRRAEAAAVGPVVVATDSPEVEAAVHRAGGSAVMTRGDHASGSDRIFEALGKIDPGGAARIVVNVQGDLPTLEPADITAPLALLADPAVDIGTPAAAITRAAERDDPAVVKVVGTPIGPSRLRATARSIIISGSTPTAARRWSVLSSLRRHRWKSGRSLSSCARSRPACASTSPLSRRRRSASTRRRIWRGRAPCYRNGHEATQDNCLPGRAGC